VDNIPEVKQTHALQELLKSFNFQDPVDFTVQRRSSKSVKHAQQGKSHC